MTSQDNAAIARLEEKVAHLIEGLEETRKVSKETRDKAEETARTLSLKIDNMEKHFREALGGAKVVRALLRWLGLGSLGGTMLLLAHMNGWLNRP